MLITVLLIILCTGVGILIYLLLDWLRATQQDLRNLQQTVHESTSQSSKELSENMRLQTQDIHARLAQAATLMGEIKKEAGEFAAVSRSMQDLHEFLKSPKLRGTLGEEVLYDLVAQMFPKKSFATQYHFKSGVIVDLVLKTEAGLLPIDSKFPMESFQVMMRTESKELKVKAKRDFVSAVKKYMQDISQKYILPQEGTMDFALMYVPSESVYYEIALENSLLDFARTQRVYPVSPTTLYAQLQTILLSFEGKKIAERSKQVFSQLRAVDTSLKQFESNFILLGKHLTNAHNVYAQSSSALESLHAKVQTTRALPSGEDEVL